MKIFKDTMDSLSNKQNKTIFNTISLLMGLFGEMQKSHAKMLKDVDNENNDDGILNVRVDDKFASARIEYLSRRSHLIILKNKSLHDVYDWYDISEEFRDIFERIYLDTIERTHVELAMIINAYLDYDPFYFINSKE
jgi:hypothetical protein